MLAFLHDVDVCWQCDFRHIEKKFPRSRLVLGLSNDVHLTYECYVLIIRRIKMFFQCD